MAVDIADWLQLTQLAAPGLLGNVTMLNGNSTVSQQFTPSPFATALIVMPNPSSLNLASIVIKGNITGAEYAAVDFPGQVTQLLPVVCPIPGNAEGSYPVIVKTLAAAVGNVVVATVYQLFGTGIQQVSAPKAQPLPVALVPLNDSNSYAAQLKSAPVYTAIAISGTLTMIAGVAGQVITLYGYCIGVRAGVAATVGTYVSTMEDTTAAVTVQEFDIEWNTAIGIGNLLYALSIPHGLPLSLGAGLKIVAAANPGTMLHHGHVLYTQQTVL